MAQSIPIECSGFHAACLNAVDSCSVKKWNPIECSGLYAAWPNASRLNAVDYMHCVWMQCTPCSVVKCIPIECSGFHGAWLNAVYSMQREVMEPNASRLNAQCIPIECSGFYAAWLNAVDSMQHDCMQWILCTMAQSIPIDCSGFHAASLNSEDSMHCGEMDPDFIKWSQCSEAKCFPIECSRLYAAWPNGSRLNAVDSILGKQPAVWCQCIFKCRRIWILRGHTIIRSKHIASMAQLVI